jgi:hypothetical protein
MVIPRMSFTYGGSYLTGFFSDSIIIAIASLIGHLIYGLFPVGFTNLNHL